MCMPEIILRWLMNILEKGAKSFWASIVILLLIMPFGIPILIVIGLIKTVKKKDRDS